MLKKLEVTLYLERGKMKVVKIIGENLGCIEVMINVASKYGRSIGAI